MARGSVTTTTPIRLTRTARRSTRLYGSLSGGVLTLGFSGNLHNFNKINIVLDYVAGGQNELSGLANLGNLSGLTLDAGVEADAVLSFTSGFGGSGGVEWFADGSLADGTGGFLGGGPVAGPLDVSLGGGGVVRQRQLQCPRREQPRQPEPVRPRDGRHRA